MQNNSDAGPDNLLNSINSDLTDVVRVAHESLTEPNGTRDCSPAAGSAISRARECRNELKQLAVLLRQTDDQPRTARKLAAGLEQTLKTLEIEIGHLENETVSLGNQLIRERRKCTPSVPVVIEPTSPLLGSSGRFEPERDPDATASQAFSRSRGLRPALSAISLICVAGAALWFVPIQPRPVTSRIGPRDANREAFVDTPPATAQTLSPQVAPGVSVNDDFSRGAEQLDAALAAYKGETPEDILTSVHNENAANGIYVCSFEWNDGIPSLLFGNEKNHVKLNAVMGRCAEAVGKH